MERAYGKMYSLRLLEPGIIPWPGGTSHRLIDPYISKLSDSPPVFNLIFDAETAAEEHEYET